MNLTPGTRLGVYEVIAQIGAGGMGQVYRARDTKLNRHVALKILHDAFASDSDRIARFKREAQTLASLNHPHIAAIYGLEDANGATTLVLELVEGPTLADRIAEGPIPLEEALPIAKQIAGALAAAHELGIVHRDIKPDNVKVQDDGTVKVLDFGLAKLVEDDGGSRGSAEVRAHPLSRSRTVTSPPMVTRPGMILGTVAYMAPEQVRGKAVDKRADIWAFGCVLYEMLTGCRAFEGEDVLAAILRDEPDWAKVPAVLPAAVRALLVRCLQKDRGKRVGDISTALFVLEEAPRLFGPTGSSPHQIQAALGEARSRLRRFAVACAVLAAVVAGTAVWFAARARMTGPLAPTAVVTRSLLSSDPFDMRPPVAAGESRTRLWRPDRTALALSPDGRTLVFRGATGRSTSDARLYRRSLGSLEVTPIDGTEGAETVYFSPDGAWIGFVTATEIKKVSINGGPTNSIAKVPGVERAHGASWGAGGPDGVVVFSTLGGLWRVSGAGGTVTSIAKPEPPEYAYKLPSPLPSGDAVLFTIQQEIFEWETARVAVRSLSTGAQKVLMEDAADGRYASSGHLLFMRRGVLMAAPFNVARLEVTGGAVAVVDDVMHAVNTFDSTTDSGAAQYATAWDGTLVYADGGMTPAARRALVWVTRSGAIERLPAPEDSYLAPRLAPGEQRVAVFTQVRGRVWLQDIGRNGRIPLTGDSDGGEFPVWSRDGKTIVLSSSIGGGAGNLYRRAADGTRGMERLTGGPNAHVPSDWSPNGATLVFVEETPGASAADIWLLDVNDPHHATRPWLQTPANEQFPAFSPDGRWLAYSSDESGRDEVYVQPFPGPGPRVRMSADGGNSPGWRGDGAELFYLSVTPSSMMVVPVKATTAGLSAGVPRKLFDASGLAITDPSRGYDVSRDGQRFITVQFAEARPGPPGRIVLVANWFDELRRRVPVR